MDDQNQTLLVELREQAALLAPQIRGFEDLCKASLSPDALAAVLTQVKSRQRRANLIELTITAIDELNNAKTPLYADGYPAVVKSPEVRPEVFDEIQIENADIDAAIGLFAPTPVAAIIEMDLGAPTLKP